MVFVKRFAACERGEHVREWSVLRRAHEHVPDLVPRPLAADLNATPPWVSMTRIPGEPLTKAMAQEHVGEVAAAVTTLWAVPHGDLGEWSDDLDFARRLTASPRPPGGVTAEAWDAAAAWWDGPDPARLRRRPGATVLGHRDPNITNYLWDGHRIRIVDFEDATVSDATTEVAILLEHLAWRDIDAAPFLACVEVDDQRLLAARRLWAMFWLWLLLPGGPSASKNPPGTADDQARRLLEQLS